MIDDSEIPFTVISYLNVLCCHIKFLNWKRTQWSLRIDFQCENNIAMLLCRLINKCCSQSCKRFSSVLCSDVFFFFKFFVYLFLNLSLRVFFFLILFCIVFRVSSLQNLLFMFLFFSPLPSSQRIFRVSCLCLVVVLIFFFRGFLSLLG